MERINNTIKSFFANMPGLFQSKRFWAAFSSAVVMIVVSVRPEFEGQAPQLSASILALALFLIKTYGDQDKASAENGYNKYLGTSPNGEDLKKS